MGVIVRRNRENLENGNFMLLNKFIFNKSEKYVVLEEN